MIFVRKNKSRQGLSRGFSFIEMMVVVAISMLIMGVALTQYKTGEQTRNVKVAGDNAESALRSMQNNTLSGKSYAGGTPPSAADYFGWKISTMTPNYFETFVKEKYTSNSRILETSLFPNRVNVSSIQVSNAAGSGGADSARNVEIRFLPPFGAVETKYYSISRGADVTLRNAITTIVLLYQGSTRQRTVTVDGVSGRISVQ